MSAYFDQNFCADRGGSLPGAQPAFKLQGRPDRADGSRHRDPELAEPLTGDIRPLAISSDSACWRLCRRAFRDLAQPRRSRHGRKAAYAHLRGVFAIGVPLTDPETAEGRASPAFGDSGGPIVVERAI